MQQPSKTIPCLLAFALVALLPATSARADVEPEPENDVEITNPSDGEVFYDAPVSLDISVSTYGISYWDEEYAVEVTLFIDGEEYGTDSEAPWVFEGVEFVEGAYTLHATALTDLDAEYTSPTAGIVVFSGPAPGTTGDESGSESGEESSSDSGSESSSDSGSESSSGSSSDSSGSGGDSSTEGSTKAGCGCQSDTGSNPAGGLLGLWLVVLGLSRRRRMRGQGAA